MRFGALRKIPKSILDNTIQTYIYAEMPPVSNELMFGVEIECEFRQRLNTDIINNIYPSWNTTQDGSLRGFSAEFVSKPMSSVEMGKALELLDNKAADMHIKESDRTSVHVHINMHGKTIRFLHKYLTLMYLLENTLVERFGGEDRVGNHFCLRAYDCNGIVDTLVEAFSSGSYQNIVQTEKYANINLSALAKFSTVEVRCHKGTGDFKAIQDWVLVLKEIYTLANVFEDSQQIMGQFSELGTVGFLQWNLPFVYEQVKDVPNLSELLYQGLEIAQDIAFAFVEVEDTKEMQHLQKAGKSKDEEILDEIFRREGVLQAQYEALENVPRRGEVLMDVPRREVRWNIPYEDI